MKTNKAFIKLNGEVGEKEIPGIEYVDRKYVKNRQKELARLLSENPEKDQLDIST